MTFEDRAREAGDELGEWAPETSGRDDAVGRARRRVRRRRATGGALAAVLVATSVVVLWPSDTNQRVIAAEPTTTTTSAVACAGSDDDVVIFVNASADDATRASLAERLGDDPAVRSTEYFDAAASYARFREMFADDPEMLAGVEEGDLPTSYRVELRDPASQSGFVSAWESVPGVYLVEPGSCGTPFDRRRGATTTSSVPVPNADLDVQVTVTSDCAEFVRAPGSAREACPPPDQHFTLADILVGGPGADSRPWPEGGVFGSGNYLLHLRTPLTDWGCSTSTEVGIAVAGEGSARTVTVTSIDGEPREGPVFVGARPGVQLEVAAGESSCTGGSPSGGSTSVRVELLLHPVAGCPLDATCPPVADRPSLGLPSFEIRDADTGQPVAGGPFPVLFLEPGRYSMLVTASAVDSACGHARTYELVVAADGALRLDLVGEQEGEVASVAAPAQTPTLVPGPLDTAVELLGAC